MKDRVIAIASASVLAAAAPALAQTDIVGTPTTSLVLANPGAGEFSVLQNDPDATPITRDFAPLGDELVRVTWRAPAGEFFEIAAPAGFDSVELSFEMVTTGFFGGGATTFATVDAIEFTSVSGSSFNSPTHARLLGGTSGGNGGLLARVDFALEAGDTYRFESFTLLATMPAAYSETFSSVGFSRFGFFGTAIDPSGTLADPGQWVRVVPTSGTAALLSVAGLAAVPRRR